MIEQAFFDLLEHCPVLGWNSLRNFHPSYINPNIYYSAIYKTQIVEFNLCLSSCCNYSKLYLVVEELEYIKFLIEGKIFKLLPSCAAKLEV